MIFDFESGVTGWVPNGSCTVSVETANPGSGAQSLRLETPDGSAYVRADFALTGLVVGTQYTEWQWGGADALMESVGSPTLGRYVFGPILYTEPARMMHAARGAWEGVLDA